jgi:hypothetical protein
MFGRVWRSWRSHSFPIFGTLLGLLYLVVAVGLPIPVATISKDTTQPFPCMHSQCGCRNAQQCWSHCCCHSLTERLAWARQNGVRPPQFVISQARAAGLNLNWLAVSNVHQAHTSKASCCQLTPSAKHRSCCETKPSLACNETGHSECGSVESKPRQGTAHVIGWWALECGGHSSNWLAGAPVPPITRSVTIYQLPVIEWLGPITSEPATCVAAVPAVPPPEWA